MGIGQYSCVLTITASNAVNSPRDVVVSLYIGDNDGELYVPSEYGTIQSAIDATFAGDRVIVAPGTYYENINFNGKDIVLTSVEPDDWSVVAGTIIDGGGLDSVVRFNGTESSECKLSGFTITGGNVPGGGGGIVGRWTEATVANCIVKNNAAGKHGGGIQGINGSIDRCTIYGNTAGMTGGGIAFSHGSIVNCLVYENQGVGGIVECNGDIINCTVVKNTSSEYGGGILWCRGTITNCLVWDNAHPQVATPDKSIVTYCCIQNWAHGGLGNITTDPLFIDAAWDIYYLQPESGCIDAGTNEPPGGLPAVDIDGNIRPIDGNDDGAAVADIGAYEVLASEVPVISVSSRDVEFWVYEGDAGPADKILGIRNSGPGMINWEISYDCDWLEANPTVGSSAGHINEVTLSIDVTGLIIGEYVCYLIVTADGALNSPQTIEVNLRVTVPLLVPAEYGTIQAAIDSAVDGDTVIVADGTYTGEGNHNIDFNGKAITVRSENGPADCIIDCENSGSGFLFWNEEDNDSVLDGFTITNANNSAIMCGGDPHYEQGSSPRISNCIITGNTSPRAGAGIFCGGGSSPAITNCVIKNNSATSGWEIVGGGGIYCEYANMTIMDCIIQENLTNEWGSGGGIHSQSSTVTVRNCLIANNACVGEEYNSGGGIYCLYSDVTIVNSTIVGNSTTGNGGGVLCYSSDVEITNSIVWDNRARNGSELAIGSGSGGWWPDDDYSSVLTVSYSDVRGGEDAVYANLGDPNPSGPGPGTLEWGEGNIDIDPLFVDAGDGDYHLRFGSACVDAGTNSPEGGLGMVDLDGKPRVLDGDSDGAAVVDMGVYESFAPDVPYMATIPNEFVFHVFEGGPNPVEGVLQIRNIGPEGFSWEILEDCDWLEAWPVSGEVFRETDEVTLHVDKSGLGVGCYSCQLSISSEEAENSPRAVEVRVYVYEPGSIRVPAKYRTIQEAIDAASSGRTVMVAPGTYRENINFDGKNIILTSIEPDDWDVVAGTIIDGQGLDSVVKFYGTESSDCKLSGFTITDGYSHADSDGGGINGAYTNATVVNCIIKNNVAQRHGGGIRHVDGLIDRCIIFGNSAFFNGGGLAGCGGTISNCLIYDNTGRLNGGGMVMCNGNIVNCTIADNTAGLSGGGLAWCSGGITNCIVWGNDLEQVTMGSYSGVRYSCVQGFYGGVGNINTEPGFVNAAGGDYHLRFDSACVDTGTNEPILELGLDADLDGNIRPLDGNHDGWAIVDMGAYEVSPPEGPYIVLNQSEFVFHGLEGGPNPAEQILEIRNPDIGSFGWEISEDCEWLDVFPTSGETAEEASEVTLQVDTSGLEAGGHICKLTILSREAVNSPRTVLVGLNIYNDGDIIVPLDYATIQGAIDAASDRQTIIVEPGTYNENIDFGGKNITLRSIKPENKAVVERTIIQGDGTDSVVRFAGTEDPNCRLAGFTITGGNVPRGGGGIRGKWTRATVANCIVKNNTAGTHGGGIQGVNGSIDRCTIYGNTAGMNGGGIAYSDGKIVNCLVYENQGVGGIVECNGNIINCTVVKNSSGGHEYGGGILWCRGTITNCLVWDNDPPQVAVPYKPIVTYSCIQDWAHGGVGNITTDPLFINAPSGDYRLSLGSPCVDAGTNEPPGGLPVLDIEGNIRPIDGDYDGEAVADIGAYEQTELVGIEIAGPGKVTENSTANYELISRHEGGSSGETADGVVNWWVEPTTYAGFDDYGVLWTQEVDSRQEIMIYAEYVKGQVSMEAQKAVSILAICPGGGALQLDGRDDYVEIVGFSGVLGVRSRTVSAWIKTNIAGKEIISWGGIELGKKWIFRLNNEGRIRLEVAGGSINGTTNIADGQWHHVAAALESDGTPDVSEVQLYVDGIEENTIGVSHEINTAKDADVRIGVFTIEGLWPQPWWEHPGLIWPPDDIGRYFEGAIDEVRIWNVGRTQDEIQANMHRRLDGDEAGLVGYWNFDEGQGQVVYDLSPKGNNGYLRRGPVWVDSEAPIGFCNTAPAADAGCDQAVFAWVDGIAEVKLDGSGSYDADGDALEYFWFIGDEQIATGVDPNVELPVGEHTIELIVDDGKDSSEPNEVVITVIAPIEADVHIVPRTINRNNRLNRIIAIMRLPEGVSRRDVADEPFELYIDVLDSEPIQAIWQRVIGWGNGVRVFSLFDYDELMDAVGNNGRKELTVVGRLESGQYVSGRDTVRIIQPRR